MPRKCPVCRSNHKRLEKIFYLDSYRLLTCSKCLFTFLDVDKEEVVKANFNYTERTAFIYESNYTFLDDEWFRYIYKRFSNGCANKRIIDIGCGNGRLLKYFKDNKNFDVYGLDVSPWAKKYAQHYGYVLYDEEVEKDYLPKDYFDVAISTSTLEHIYDPYKHIKSILRILKPGGILFVSGLPNFGSLTVRLGISKFYFNKPPSHVNYFTPRSMYNLLKRLKRHYKISFNVKTYGIPESFYLYHKIREIYKALRNRNKESRKHAIYTKPTKNNKNRASVLEDQNVKGIKKAIGQIAVYLNYFIGRPFNLGDKIEVVIYKEQ